MHRLEFTPDALEDLRWLRKYDQQLIVDRLDEQLHADPTVKTRHRKPMRPNELASWELRIGEFRVFYDVEEANVVKIKAVGWKEHNRLLIRGREYQL